MITTSGLAFALFASTSVAQVITPQENKIFQHAANVISDESYWSVRFIFWMMMTSFYYHILTIFFSPRASGRGQRIALPRLPHRSTGNLVPRWHCGPSRRLPRTSIGRGAKIGRVGQSKRVCGACGGATERVCQQRTSGTNLSTCRTSC